MAVFLWGDPDPDQLSKVCLDHGASKDRTGESTLVMDSPVPLMHRDPDRSWITDPDPDHPKGTQPMSLAVFCMNNGHASPFFQLHRGVRSR